MKRKLMFLMTFLFIGIGLVTAQTSRVTGLVTSEEDGQPVVGASILVNGTTLGTITDIDGKFTIANVPSSAKTYWSFFFLFFRVFFFYLIVFQLFLFSQIVRFFRFLLLKFPLSVLVYLVVSFSHWFWDGGVIFYPNF